MKWKATQKRETAEGRTIVYESEEIPAELHLHVESRLRHIPHSPGSGSGGTWDHTDYWVIYGTFESGPYYALKTAKEVAEILANKEAAPAATGHGPKKDSTR